MILKHALYHMWLWKREQILYSFLFSCLGSVIYHFSPYEHPILSAGIIILTLIPVFAGLAKDQFSWKYYQSIPFSKRELYHFIILSQFIFYLPLLTWFLCFPDVLPELFTDLPKVSLWFILGGVVLFAIGSVYIGIMSFSQLFEMIRAPFAKKTSKVSQLQTLRNVILGANGIALLLYAAYKILTDWPSIAQVIGSLLSFFFKENTFLTIAGLVCISLSSMYYRTFRRWMREELSYQKINFNKFRDLPLMIAGTYTVYVIFMGINLNSHMYGRSPLVDAIANKDLKQIQKLSMVDVELNTATKRGWTPLMVAAHEGDERLFTDFLRRGASQEGIVKTQSDLLHNKMNLFFAAVDGKNIKIVRHLLTPERARSSNGSFSPLHIASYNCSLDIIDLLIESGANPNERNDRGETPLHVAARRNCFAGAVSLIEAGADPQAKDKKENIALNLIHKSRKDFSYYMEKKSRAPASN